MGALRVVEHGRSGKTREASSADAAPGDRLSGTVRVEPAAERPRRRARQASTLRGYVIETPEGSASAGEDVLHLLAPAAEVLPLLFRRPDGEAVARSEVSLAPAAPG